MDNVSYLKFDFKLIRAPRTKSRNIFAYAAFLKIFDSNSVFLTIEDVCIIDFINKLNLYDGSAHFELIPIDSVDKVLIFKKINSNLVEVSSEWTKRIIIVDFNQLIESIQNLKINFEKIAKISVDKYIGEKH